MILIEITLCALRCILDFRMNRKLEKRVLAIASLGKEIFQIHKLLQIILIILWLVR